MRLHGGTIKVESLVGQGTTFSVTIPFGRSHLPATGRRTAQESASTAVGVEAYRVETLRWLPESGAVRGLRWSKLSNVQCPRTR